MTERPDLDAIEAMIPRYGGGHIRALLTYARALEQERAELLATLANERGEGEPPSPGWPVSDTFAAKLAAARAANRLAFHESKAVCAGCGYEAHVARQYRCRWCGVYYCGRCSVEHFAPTVASTDVPGVRSVQGVAVKP